MKHWLIHDFLHVKLPGLVPMRDSDVKCRGVRGFNVKEKIHHRHKDIAANIV